MKFEIYLKFTQHKRNHHVRGVGIASKRRSNKIQSRHKCESVKDLKNNFRNMYNDEVECRLKCQNKIDSQQHTLECHVIITHLRSNQKEFLKQVKYEHLFGKPKDQLKIAKMFIIILRTRERLLERNQEHAHHGNNSAPDN